VQKTVADLQFVMDAVFPLVPGEKIQEKRVSLSPAKSRTVGVWTSFSGIPLDERIRDSMEAVPRRLESTQVSDDGPRLAARITPGPSLGLARLHKALEVRIRLPCWKSTQNWVSFTVRVFRGFLANNVVIPNAFAGIYPGFEYRK
jgi:hypothetical protein